MTAAPHLRAILIAGALACAAAALGWWTLARQAVQTASPPAPAATVVDHAAPARPARAAPAQPKAARARTEAPKTKPEPAGPAPVVRAALAYGLPRAVAVRFADHPVVVVSLYGAHADLDRMAEREAQAGAARGGAGFAAVDTTRNGPAAALTKLLGLVDPPATLVFQRPPAAEVRRYLAAAAADAHRSPLVAATTPLTPPQFPVFVTLSGYNDAETVAQAAVNAAPAAPVATSAWAARANALCTSAFAQIASSGVADSPAAARRVLPAYRRLGRSFVARLRALTPPPGQKAAVRRFVAAEARATSFGLDLTAATARRDGKAVTALFGKGLAASGEAGALAVRLGATSCRRDG